MRASIARFLPFPTTPLIHNLTFYDRVSRIDPGPSAMAQRWLTRAMTNISLTLLDETFGETVEALKVVTRMRDTLWGEAQPAYSLFNRIIIFFLFPSRVCVVKS